MTKLCISRANMPYRILKHSVTFPGVVRCMEHRNCIRYQSLFFSWGCAVYGTQELHKIPVSVLFLGLCGVWNTGIAYHSSLCVALHLFEHARHTMFSLLILWMFSLGMGATPI
ncbi:hypothetical protein DPEC_G00380160 [Dallia pectoralis]|nr:hypothetical protein DPEC_G00380160 [Dallia pectoralis]